MKIVPDIESTPREVKWSEVADFDQLDERVSAVTCVFGSVIGVNEGYIEWCPDNIPPTEQERLAWIWATAKGTFIFFAVLKKMNVPFASRLICPHV